MPETVGPEFVSLTELSDYLQESIDIDNETDAARGQAALAMAEALTCGVLGCETLAERQVEVSVKLPRYKTLIEVPDGPIASIENVNSVTVSGESAALEADLLELAHPWMIGRNDQNFPKQTAIALDYLAGFRIESDGTTTMPARIKQAILAWASNIFVNPNSRLVMERIGDYQYQLGGFGPGGEVLTVPGEVEILLRGWRKPRL